MARVFGNGESLGSRAISGQVLTPPAFLLDLDGTLYTPEGPVLGAIDALNSLRRRGIPLRFVTNTTRSSREGVLTRMRGYGFTVDDHELFTPTVAATVVLRRLGAELVAPFVAPATFVDLETFQLAGGTAPSSASVPDVVLVGDLGPAWSPALLNEAFRYLMAGARLIALQKGRYWLGSEGLEVDAGAWVAALEYASGQDALVCGKPETPFFEAVLSSVDVDVSDDRRPVMVGDDLTNDVHGAQRAGLEGWLVRTGKFRPDVLARSDIVPDRVIDSVAALAD